VRVFWTGAAPVEIWVRVVPGMARTARVAVGVKRGVVRVLVMGIGRPRPVRIVVRRELPRVEVRVVIATGVTLRTVPLGGSRFVNVVERTGTARPVTVVVKIELPIVVVRVVIATGVTLKTVTLGGSRFVKVVDRTEMARPMMVVVITELPLVVITTGVTLNTVPLGGSKLVSVAIGGDGGGTFPPGPMRMVIIDVTAETPDGRVEVAGLANVVVPATV